MLEARPTLRGVLNPISKRGVILGALTLAVPTEAGTEARVSVFEDGGGELGSTHLHVQLEKKRRAAITANHALGFSE